MADSTSSIFSDAMNFLTFTNVVTGLSSSAMMIGGIIPYVPQYQEIRRTLNADGFSLYVCLTLLVANTLRIVFWFGHSFELPLLLQSIIMNVAMLSMIHLCIKVKNHTQLVPLRPQHFLDGADDKKPSHSFTLNHPSSHSFWDFDIKYFWQWTDFLSYVEFLATFTAATGIMMYFFVDVVFVVELVGFLALFTEAMLGVPQFYKNFQKKSTFGMSKKMVFLWTVGDIFKTTYFVARNAPSQFWVCGVLQVFIDFAILSQVVFYRVAPSPMKVFTKGKHIS